MKVQLIRDGLLWCFWWLNPPFKLVWDRPGIPSSTYLNGWLCEASARNYAAQNGWEIVG